MAGYEEMSLSFGSAAGAYESGRPDYPREAVDWMLAPLRGHERALCRNGTLIEQNGKWPVALCREA